MKDVGSTIYARFIGGPFYLVAAVLLFACIIEDSSILQEVGFIGGGLVFLVLGVRLIFFGRVRVNREAQTLEVPRLLWGKRKVLLRDIVGVGISSTVLVIGEWGDGATVVTLAVREDGSGKVKSIKCYSLCGYGYSSAVNRKFLELRDSIGNWNGISRVDWFAGSPITGTDTGSDE